MQIDYDPEADAMYIRLRDGDIDDTLQTNKYIFVDVDKDVVPLGKEDITNVTVNFGTPVVT